MPTNKARIAVSILNLVVWGSGALYLIAFWSNSLNSYRAALPTFIGLFIGVVGFATVRRSSRWWLLGASIALVLIMIFNLSTVLSQFPDHACAICEAVQFRISVMSAYWRTQDVGAALRTLWNDIILPLTILATLVVAVREVARGPANLVTPE